ncbi:MAG: hypothetical protein E7160_04370 [Firmicutes bacterium]|nr:hypothetical protein [Bacillota bacterium]
MKVERSEGYCYFDYKLTDHNNKDNYIKYDSFLITKENYYIYEYFNQLYSDIENCNVYNDEYLDGKICDSYQHSNIFQDGIVVFESDDPNDDEKFDEVNFNVLKISKEEDKYKLEFIFNNSKDKFMNHSIRIRNSGSKYHPFNIVFMNFFRSLQEYDPEYHQMYIEEYVYKKKLRG